MRGSAARPGFLVTGAASGLGRYLHEALGGVGLTRASAAKDLRELRARGAECIVHCAATARRPRSEADLLRLLDDNLLFTEALARLPHARFVFLSTIDLYPRGAPAREDGPLAPDAALSPYAMTKRLGEALVLGRCREPLILRPATLLGPYARPNSLTRAVSEPRAELSLTADSDYNLVLHEDILAFLRLALDQGTAGVFNAAASGNFTLGEAARLAGRTPRFGTHRYEAGAIDNAKIAALCPAFRRGSRENLARYLAAKSHAET